MTSGSGSDPRRPDGPSPGGPAPGRASSATEPPPQPEAIESRPPAESAAAVISRALGGDGAAEPPAPRRGRLAAALAVLLLVAGVSGYVAGGPGTSATRSRTVAAGAIRLSIPKGWQRRPPRQGIESVAPRPLVARPPGGSAQSIVAAELPRSGLGLLPGAAVGRLEGISEGQPVRLGDLSATRYGAVESAAPRRSVTLFASPTKRGVALVACAGSRARGSRFMDRCQAVAASLSLAGRRAVSDPAADGVAEVDRAIKLLDSRRAAAGQRLRRAGSRAASARIVRALAAAHAGARRALEGLPEGSGARRAGAPVIRSLRSVERAYGLLAGALRGGSRRREQAARVAVRRRDALLRRATARL